MFVSRSNKAILNWIESEREIETSGFPVLHVSNFLQLKVTSCPGTCVPRRGSVPAATPVPMAWHGSSLLFLTSCVSRAPRARDTQDAHASSADLRGDALKSAHCWHGTETHTQQWSYTTHTNARTIHTHTHRRIHKYAHTRVKINTTAHTQPKTHRQI